MYKYNIIKNMINKVSITNNSEVQLKLNSLFTKQKWLTKRC